MDIIDITSVVQAATEGISGSVEKMGAFIGAGIAVGAAGLGVGAGQGFAAGKIAEAVARNPEMRSKILSTTIIAIAISESGVIYGLVIAIILIFVV